jgi:3-oxoacyl-[acyl-carrier protein] reductase
VDAGLNAPVLDLRHRVALVTGGSRGVGRATALLLARAGAAVAVGYRARRAEAEAVVAAIHARGGVALAHGADLTVEEEAPRFFQAVEEALGRVDLFVGNHGVWPPEDVPLAEMSTGQWQRTLRANLDSIFYLTREAARRLPDGGRIVLVTSTAAQRGEAGHGDYAASKGALGSLVKGLAVELAPREITVNAVAPGWVDTEMVASALAGGGRDRALQGIPLRRLAAPEDVAGPIVFLCSRLARHVTGEILNVNGGAVRPG